MITIPIRVQILTGGNMAEESKPPSEAPAPAPVPQSAKKPPIKPEIALELSKVIIPVIGTILAACLSGVFLILNSNNFFTPKVEAQTPTVLVVTATAVPATPTFPPPTAAPSVTPTDVVLPTPTPVQINWKLAFKDDFSDVNSGWGNLNTYGSIREYVDGGYQLSILVNGKEALAFPTMNRLLKDVRVEVDAVKMAGEGDYEIGVICRNETSADLYDLSYTVTKDISKFGIYKWVGPNYQTLGEVVITDPTWINPGKQANHLRADCVGSTLTLYLNGKKGIEVTDASLKVGNVGLIVGFTDGIKVFYDNFVVYEP